MIYEYEAAFLEYISKCEPSIKEATYAKEEDMFGALTNVTKYPAFFYNRQETEYPFPKSMKVEGVEFIPYEQVYVGRIITGTVKDAFILENKLRFWFQHNAYLYFKWRDEVIKVELRHLYIKLIDSRDNFNNKGPKRILEFSWRSNLAFVFDDSKKYNESLVEEIHIIVTAQGEEIYDKNNNLIIILNERSIPID